MANYADRTLPEIRQLPGISDLPLAVAGKFALALKAEGEGDHARAEQLLAEAIALEERLTAGS